MTSPGQEQSTGELLRQLVRQELHQARDELVDKARRSVPAVVCLGAAAVLGAASVGASTATVIRLLDRALPAPAAAAVTTAGLGGTAAALALAGLRQLRTVNPVPEQTIRSLRSDVEAAADDVR